MSGRGITNDLFDHLFSIDMYLGSAGLISGPKMAKNQRFLWAIAAQGPKRTFKVNLTRKNCAPNDFSRKLVDLILLINHIGPAWLQSWP